MRRVKLREIKQLAQGYATNNGRAEVWTLVAWLVAQMVKNLPAMQETRIRALGQEDPLERGMATQSSILAWRIPCTEEPGGLQSMWSQRVRHDWVTNTFIFKIPYLDSTPLNYDTQILAWRISGLKPRFKETPAVTQQKGNQERKDVPTVEAQKLLTA